MKEIKIGVVGLAWGQRHVGTIKNIEGARVTAVAYDRALPDGTSVEDFGKRVGAQVYSDGIEMIKNADIDAVDICTSPKWREPLLAAAAARGLPVLVEKPMALSVADAERFARIAREAGIPLMVEYPMRFLPAIVRAKALLGDGPLGRPLSVEGNLQTTWNPPVGHWTWDAGNEGGIVLESGCHLIDTMCFLCGEPTSVFASGRNVRGNGKQEDTATLLMEFAGGCTASANIGVLGTEAYKNPPYLRLYCENGEAVVTGEDWRFGTVEWATSRDASPKKEVLEVPPRLEIPRFNLIAFVQMARDRTEPPCTAADGIRVQRVIAAMEKSIRTRLPVGVAK